MKLDQLENGSPESIYFGFAVFLLSAGISFGIALPTATIGAVKPFNVFLIAALLGVLGGVLPRWVWPRSRRSNRNVVKTIRDRKLPPVTTQP